MPTLLGRRVNPRIHVAARRFGETQRCRRCGEIVHHAWQSESGRWSTFRVGHRLLEQDTPKGRSLTDIDRGLVDGSQLVRAIDQATPCQRGSR